MNSSPIDNVVTVAEAARMANVSTDTIERQCKRGGLKARKSNGTWLIDRKSVIKKYKIK